MSDPTDVSRLSADELKTLFLFESLDDEQLGWLSEHGYVEYRAAGEPVFTEGEDATCFFVLLSGTLSSSRRVEQTELDTGRTNQRGVYSGATLSFLRTEETPKHHNSVTAVTDSESARLSSTRCGPT
ncbi:MAG: cyclic nucleotide-binding domain-containing protein [Propionibacteriaceae bacterium]|nr:cyclic nucleotide-binding domain-containing protein [Propionibacteriaceae bacterium]